MEGTMKVAVMEGIGKMGFEPALSPFRRTTKCW